MKKYASQTSTQFVILDYSKNRVQVVQRRERKYDQS